MSRAVRLIDNEALLEALANSRIDAASLDVTEPEPLPVGHPFYTHPRIRLSPHTSAIGPHNAVELAASSHAISAPSRNGTTLEDLVDIRRGY